MPVAVNDKGDALYFDDSSKSWKPTKIATNDKGEKKAFDGKVWVDLPGSVFDKPNLGQRIGRTEQTLKGLAPAAAGAFPAIAGAEEGAALGSMVSPGIGTAVGGAIGAGIGGAFSPAVARQVVAAQTKQPYQSPPWKEVAKSAAFNAGMTGLFGAIGAGSGRAVAAEPEIRSLPAEAQTAGNVKQAMRNRDFWKQMGLSDEQATEALRSPDVHAELERQIQSGQRYKAAFKTVADNARANFHQRYQAIFGEKPPQPTIADVSDVRPEFAGEQLNKAGIGPSGLSVTPHPNRAMGENLIAYRAPDGKPIAILTYSKAYGSLEDAALQDRSRLKNYVVNFAVDKNRGLLVGKAVKAVADKAKELGIDPGSVMTPDAARFLTKYTSQPHINAVSLGRGFEAAAQAGGQHEISPAFRAFLQRKGLELTNAGETAGPSVGGVPWKQLPEKLKDQIRSQGGAQGIKTPSSDMSIEEARALRTELRENLPSNATNLDQKVYQQLHDQITAAYEKHLAPEQKGALNALDQEYGRFQDVLKTLDPRSERYGTQVANALFDPMVNNQGDALNFVKLAQEAEAARPGEVMPQLREGFLEHATNESRVATQGRPVEEMQALRKLQAKWGGDKQLKTVLQGVYGKNSPLTDATTFSKVVGVLGNPDASAAKASKTVLTGAGELLTRGTSFLTRLAVSYGIYRSIAGGTGSPWKDIGNPEAMIPALAGAWMLGKVGSPILASADTALQRTYVNYLLNPTPNTFRLLGESLGASGAGLLVAPSLTAEPSAPTPAPPPR